MARGRGEKTTTTGMKVKKEKYGGIGKEKRLRRWKNQKAGGKS